MSYSHAIYINMLRVHHMFVVLLFLCYVHESDQRRLLLDKNDTRELQSNVKEKNNHHTIKSSSPSILNDLKELQRKINLDYDSKKWGVISDGSYSFTRLATRLVTEQFDYLIGELPVFVYDAPTHTDDYLGNRLGNYFEAVTCANMAGLHFVCLTNQTDANKLAQGLPTIIVHPNPAKTKLEAFKNVNTTCIVDDNKFPWENPMSLQYSHPSVVRVTFGAAVDKYIHQNMHDNCGQRSVNGGTGKTDGSNSRRRLEALSLNDGNISSSSRIPIHNTINLTLPSTTTTTTIADKTTAPSNTATTHCVPYDTFSYVSIPGIHDVDIENDKDNEKAKRIHQAHAMMPLIPSVSILFRCCDILVMKSDQYGFIKWIEYLSRIPKQNTTHIYILTEGSSYNECGYFPACKEIQKQLVSFLRHHYPLATVAIRRGNPNDAMVMLSRAPIVICCSSTFCLYPALSRSTGVSYLQHTSLLAGGKEPIINEHVKWISADHISFTHPGGGKDHINSPGFIKTVVDRLKPSSSNNNDHAVAATATTRPTRKMTTISPPMMSMSSPSGKEMFIHFIHYYKRHISHAFFIFLICFILHILYRIIFQ